MIEVGTRVVHPEYSNHLGTVIEIGFGYQEGRARVRWDDVNHPAGTRWDGSTYPERVAKGKRTWIALSRLQVAAA